MPKITQSRIKGINNMLLFQKVIHGNIVNKVINGNIVNMLLKIIKHPIYNIIKYSLQQQIHINGKIHHENIPI